MSGRARVAFQSEYWASLRVPPCARGRLRQLVQPRPRRDPVLHDVPEPARPALPRRRRRADRAREDRGPARGRGRRARRRARGAARGRGARARGLAAARAARLPRATISRAPSSSSPRPRTPSSTCGVFQEAEARTMLVERRRRAAALQLHHARDRAQRPDLDRRLDARREPGARQAAAHRDLRDLRRAVRAARRDAQRHPRLGARDAADLPGSQGLLRGDRERPARSDRPPAPWRRRRRARDLIAAHVHAVESAGAPA